GSARAMCACAGACPRSGRTCPACRAQDVTRDVERLEVVIVVLELRAFGHREAEADEDGHDLVLHARERIQAPAHGPAPAQRQVDPVPRALETALGFPRLAEPQFEQRLELTLDLPPRRPPAP